MRNVNIMHTITGFAVAAALTACGALDSNKGQAASAGLPRATALVLAPQVPASVGEPSAECEAIGRERLDAAAAAQQSPEAERWQQSSTFQKVMEKAVLFNRAQCVSMTDNLVCHAVYSDLMAQTATVRDAEEYKAFEASPDYQRMKHAIQQGEERGCWTASNAVEVCQDDLLQFERDRQAQAESPEMQALKGSDAFAEAMAVYTEMSDHGCQEDSATPGCNELQRKAGELARAVDDSAAGKAVLTSPTYETLLSTFRRLESCMKENI